LFSIAEPMTQAPLQSDPAPGFCRDCLAPARAGSQRCHACGSPRLIRHAEIDALALAHMDCDAFYASVEKRDNPELRDKPVIIGGGRRGVVSTACYIARIRGVRSAMPMFQALKLCPEAVVVPTAHGGICLRLPPDPRDDGGAHARCGAALAR
jgi:DNA polymerase-4